MYWLTLKIKYKAIWLVSGDTDEGEVWVNLARFGDDEDAIEEEAWRKIAAQYDPPPDEWEILAEEEDYEEDADYDERLLEEKYGV